MEDEQNKEEKQINNIAYLKIQDLTEEEIMLILKYRSKQGKNGFAHFIKKEPLYIWGNLRSAILRYAVNYGIMYLMFKYGISEMIK